jgi:hypothetical protein
MIFLFSERVSGQELQEIGHEVAAGLTCFKVGCWGSFAGF